MKHLSAWLCIVLAWWVQPVIAGTPDGEPLLGRYGAQEFLDPDDAFRITASQGDGRTIILQWRVEQGYYLYRDKIAVTPKDGTRLTLGLPQLPAGRVTQDEYFGEVTSIEHDFQSTVPVLQVARDMRAAELLVSYQGCAEAGLCYPPLTKTLVVDFNPDLGAGTPWTGSNGSAADPPGFQSEQDRLAGLLASGKLWLTVASFFGLGVLLAFTPCVFPMIPILSGIIVGQGAGVSTSRAFTLSLIYVLAMSVAYTAAGIAVGLSGENIQFWLQTPWVLGAFAGILVLLSLSMFGLYELQLPQALRSRVHAVTSGQRQGSYVGAAVMGFLSALIVGPCINAPLIGALIYIANVGDAVLGGTALFALSLGMGLPLLVLGTSEGKLLPKAGAWMGSVKAVSGVLLLGLAIWLLERVMPAPIVLMLTGILLIASSVYMGALERVREGASGWFRLWKGLGVIALVYGTVLVIGAAAGSHSLLHPLQGMMARNVDPGTAGYVGDPDRVLPFRQIKGVEGLDTALRQAAAEGKPVMLDFYADWCISCKEMEAFTFSKLQVRRALQNFVLLQSDVTHHDEQDRALLKHLGLFGPPAILFYDPSGQERYSYRLIGFMGASGFSSHLERFKEAVEPGQGL